jgi:hypothetical protein
MQASRAFQRLGAVIWRFRPPFALAERYFPLSKTPGGAILAPQQPPVSGECPLRNKAAGIGE